MPNDPSTGVPSPSAPTWENWSKNLIHRPAGGANYYFTPANLKELRSVLDAAKVTGATVRVSGQRHSQSPLVIDDNRGVARQTTESFLVDMSCYKDLGPGGDQRMVLLPGRNAIAVNTGVREDELDAFLTQNNLMLKTVTAGGFFSVGGMTAVDVHGGTVDAPIFAETVSAFNILLADGSPITIDKQSPPVAGWSPLQFARVSLGALGIVTSVAIDVMERPYATTLRGGLETYAIRDSSTFVSRFRTLLKNHARLEVFFTPYAAAYFLDNFWALWWDTVDEKSDSMKTPNQPPRPYPKTACDLAGQSQPEYGAPYLSEANEGFAQIAAQSAQLSDSAIPSAVIARTALAVIASQVAAANQSHSDLWLTWASRVIFMSYYVPLPDLEAAGLAVVWKGLDAVARIVTQDGAFHIAAPMEFRFVKGGSSAMSGAYSNDPNAWFVNLDIIAFVDSQQKASGYPPKLLQFFAGVEREWVNLGGFPHNGKMYGFYDPRDAPGAYSKTGPFNPNFLAGLRARRGARLEAFNTYRKSVDPNGLFYNEFLRSLLER